MNTNYWTVDKDVDSLEGYPQIEQASDLLSKNEVVAFPTETVYGLGGNAKSDEAVEKIFAAKGRPSDNPLIIHIAEGSQLEEFVEEITDNAVSLMNHISSGPLTIIVNYKKVAISGKSTVS